MRSRTDSSSGVINSFTFKTDHIQHETVHVVNGRVVASSVSRYSAGDGFDDADISKLEL